MTEKISEISTPFRQKVSKRFVIGRISDNISAQAK